jgi:hypothetical protein
MASLEGTVTDQTGAIVPGTALILENEETGVKQARKTDSRGYFLVNLIPPGSYKLTATANGFEAFERRQMVLQVQQRANVDVRLTVGALTSTVAVTGEAPRLDTVEATLGRVVDRQTLLSMPVSDKNALNLVFLAAGVTSPLAPGLGWTGSNFVSHGSRQAMSDILVDGVTATVREQNGGATDVKYRPTVENIEELKVQTNSFSAEYGFTGGTVINMVSRSGTNQLHGNLYETLQNSALNANDFFANSAGRPLVSSRQNLFGFTVRRPIIIPRAHNAHDKTFFYFTQEWPKHYSQLTTLATHPTPLQLKGDFSQTFCRMAPWFRSTIPRPLPECGGCLGGCLSPGTSSPRTGSIGRRSVSSSTGAEHLGRGLHNANNFFNSGARHSMPISKFQGDHTNDRQRLSAGLVAPTPPQAPHFWGSCH